MNPDAAASVKARLLNQARANGEEFELTLSRFAAQRWLFRLGESAARSRCILKGASLLAVWLVDPYRATRDVDVLLSGPADDSAIRSLLEEVCSVEYAEDGLRFDLTELVLTTIRPDEIYSGKRARFRAFLGKAGIPVRIDLGVGDALTAPPQEIVYPTLLRSLLPPRLRAYPREASVAEKFEAMVKPGTLNGRMKDFHDVWALAGVFEFDGASLRAAVAACFERRGTPWSGEIHALTPSFYQRPNLQTRWRSYRAASTVLTPPPASFDTIGERVIDFLGPLRSSVLEDDPFELHWTAGGPWR
jgi:hypothetical protein